MSTFLKHLKGHLGLSVCLSWKWVFPLSKKKTTLFWPKTLFVHNMHQRRHRFTGLKNELLLKLGWLTERVRGIVLSHLKIPTWPEMKVVYHRRAIWNGSQDAGSRHSVEAAAATEAGSKVGRGRGWDPTTGLHPPVQQSSPGRQPTPQESCFGQLSLAEHADCREWGIVGDVLVRFPDWLESHFPSGSGNLTRDVHTAQPLSAVGQQENEHAGTFSVSDSRSLGAVAISCQF